jgi:hypothetical protein
LASALCDPWADMPAEPQSIERLRAMYQRDIDNGMQDAPWPPVYPKMPGEPPRVAPSRAKKAPSSEDEGAEGGDDKPAPRKRAPRKTPPGKSRGI